MTRDEKDAIWNFLIGLGIIILIIAGFVIAGYTIFSSSNEKSNTISATDSETSGDTDTNDCYDPSNVRLHYGEQACVNFNVGYTYETGAGTKFLDQYVDYARGFQIYIPIGSEASEINLEDYDGKNIKVTGIITEYNGAPQITVTEPSQIVILP